MNKNKKVYSNLLYKNDKKCEESFKAKKYPRGDIFLQEIILALWGGQPHALCVGGRHKNGL